jgi:ABC-type uncharacterized transport system YnjBCD permease subunit
MIRAAPAVFLLVIGLPVAAGLAGTLAAAFGHLPALSGQIFFRFGF